MSLPPTVVVSIDAELGWGFHDLASMPSRRVDAARESWLRVVDLFEDHEIPATWAVVGHLFLDGCSGTHDDHPAPAEWFDRDPGGVRDPGSIWFGPDLVTAIRDSDVDHEIGSHSFSHVEFGASETTAEIAEAELRRTRRVVDDDLDLTAFVFPRNEVGHRGLLADHGFTCYRGIAPHPLYHPDARPGMLPDGVFDLPLVRQVGKFVAWPLGFSRPPIVTPEFDEYGLVNVPSSLYLFGFEGPPRTAVETLFENPVLRQVELGLERLRNEGEGVFHLWFHPNNVTTDEAWQRMVRVATLLSEYRDHHGIAIETMSSVADRVRERAPRAQAARVRRPTQ